ncbi:MAG: SPOR domain-containing protein [Caulobacteraceae bacterium]
MRPPPAASVAALLLGALAAGAARSQAIDPLKAQDWLERSFGIKSEKVVEATPDALVVLKTIEPKPPSDFRVIVHLEDFAPNNPLTPPSSEQEYFVNCPSRRFHVERIESFSQNGARGSQSTSFGPTAWGKPIPNSTEERIISAVCDPVASPVQARAGQPSPAAAAAQGRPGPSAATVRPIPRPAPLPPIRSAQKPAPPRPPQPGSARAQLFAGADRDSAQRFVKALPAKLQTVAGARAPEIIEGSSGGHPVYRVQITGFASPVDAARFCATARAAGVDCFVPPGGAN